MNGPEEKIQGDSDLGYRAEIHLDDCPESPREWDNLGKLYMREYVGDSLKFIDSIESALQDAAGTGAVAFQVFVNDRMGDCHIGDNPIYFPFGQVSQDTLDGCRYWDGVIYCPREVYRKEYGGSDRAARKKAARYLRGEIEAYSQYASGDVWYIQILDAEDETVDSCGGFYGLEYAREEAARMLKYCEESAREDKEKLAIMESTEGAGI